MRYFSSFHTLPHTDCRGQRTAEELSAACDSWATSEFQFSVDIIACAWCHLKFKLIVSVCIYTSWDYLLDLLSAWCGPLRRSWALS